MWQEERLGIAHQMSCDVVGLFGDLPANEGRKRTEQLDFELSRQSFLETCHQLPAIGRECYVIDHNSNNDKIGVFAEEVELSAVWRVVERPRVRTSPQ